MTARPGRSVHVELSIDALVLPAGCGGEQAVRDAVEHALREHLTERLGHDVPTTTRHADVTVDLREPAARDAAGLGRQVAAEVTRAVLP
ncbi:hypothetical protein FXF50_04655 [Micromonospora sp. AP08]|uniref:hypothetical protein n=1 Tax=Micromonospora sp. AP08 TaxID=2604467 RepID=UPI0011D561E1|nr:hypothetical protein [Micromonospora sp. AP08]TYB39674.1 hypothetical protein FXF50_04655 [Micromonospora sp. AP08]